MLASRLVFFKSLVFVGIRPVDETTRPDVSSGQSHAISMPEVVGIIARNTGKGSS